MEVWGFWISVFALVLGIISAWPALARASKAAKKTYIGRAKEAETKRGMTLRLAQSEPCFLIAYVSFRSVSAIAIVWIAIQNFNLLFSFDIAWLRIVSLLVGVILFITSGRLLGDVLGITSVIVRNRLISEEEKVSE